MQYIKLGFLKIPCQIRGAGEDRVLQIAGLEIPYVTYEKNQRKYYKFGPLAFPMPSRDKWFMNQRQANYRQRSRLDQKGIEAAAARIFREKLGYPLNLKEPKTFNEKIFWLKLHYHDPLITKCCDKFAVKDYVRQVLGPGYVIPTLASWDRAEDIDFSALPERYVLKVNWSSGYNIIVRDPGQIREAEFRQKIQRWMEPEQNSYFQTFNWGYRDMKPVVYAEEYMEQVGGQLYDYKFFCCNGKVRFLFIATDRYQGKNAKLTHDFFDADFEYLPFTYGGRGHADPRPQKPERFDEMVELAQKLAEPFPFVRVDFYEAQGKLYVGEMTFYPGGGILGFDPPQWDAKMGEYIDLPKVTE